MQCLLNNGVSKPSYAHIQHEALSILKENESEDIYTISHDEFKENFREVSAAFSGKSIWVKKLSLNNECIGAIFIANKHNAPVSSNDTTALIEFSERFSTIYITHKQSAILHYKAHFDSLTKLSNRSHLLTVLNVNWHEAIKNDTAMALYYIDLDNFKNVNDLSGHKAGNQVLIEVANRISNCIEDNSFLARLSGDEFCILSTMENDMHNPYSIAQNIVNSLSEPFIINDMSFYLGASIGIAIGPKDCAKPESLLERADIAMYKAKQEGKNKYMLFDSQIKEERDYRLSLEHHLHTALEHNEISINFQPKIELSSGRMTSVECLARWHQRDLGFIPTDKFISLAEESGMITDIGTWILRKSCYQFMDWLNKDIVLDSIAVNVSARQLASRSFSETVASVIEETGIPAHCLDLEITESAFINDESLLHDELMKLSNLGTKISIDDFGKEYSSLSYLKKIPFDTLKIDREFIIDLENDKRDQHIIDVIINIGHTLNKKIVAEGIETINQRNLLKEYGCDIGQGYLFSRPLSDVEFLEFATKYKHVGMETQVLEKLS